MNHLSNKVSALLVCVMMSIGVSYAHTFAHTSTLTSANQTDTLSPIQPETGLPFRVKIELANFGLPMGIHSGVVGIYKGLWIFIAGRINGLHGFGPDPFPPDFQNTSIFVVNPATGSVTSRSIKEAGSGLTQQQIDTLSVTSPQGFQESSTLYMTGGYGYDKATSTYSTKPVLTAFNLPGVVDWVMQPGNKSNTLASNIRQVYNPIFQVTGGKMIRLGNAIQLVFGQNFTGVYTDGSNGEYSQQVRQFLIKETNGQLSVQVLNSKPAQQDPNFRRRDLNVMPVLYNSGNLLKHGLVAYAGVFTPASGVWTVPVLIPETGNPVMADPNAPSTFKQGMNHYVCATAGLYSRKYASMYNIFLGGISFGFYTGNTFNTDAEIPFINQVTTVKLDKNGHFTQYLMSGQYPVIPSTQSNPGNPLLFGAGAYYIPALIQQYPFGIINLDNIHTPTVIGYIVGGIQSTLANTNTQADSAASPYVFKVTLSPAA